MPKPMTWQKLTQRILEGRGQGQGDDYLPWLWVHRKNASPVSNQVVSRLPGYLRASHFFSRTEWFVALLCRWLGCEDIREQFPMWPMPHPHPLTQGIPDWRTTDVPGLIDIALEAGIRHGIEIGSNGVPYVATMDTLVTVDTASRRLASLSMKPYDKVTRAEPTDRLIERQEMERRYTVLIDSYYVIVDASLFNRSLRANLETLACKHSIQLPRTNQTEDLLGTLEFASKSVPFADAIAIAAAKAKMPKPDAQPIFLAAAWHGDADIDITQPIRPDLPLSYGGSDIRRELRRELFGDRA